MVKLSVTESNFLFITICFQDFFFLILVQYAETAKCFNFILRLHYSLPSPSAQYLSLCRTFVHSVTIRWQTKNHSNSYKWRQLWFTTVLCLRRDVISDKSRPKFTKCSELNCILYKIHRTITLPLVLLLFTCFIL